MARNIIKSGDVITLTAPSGGVVSGTPKVIGSFFGIPLTTAAEGVSFELALTGEVNLTKVGSQAWAEGDKVYFNSSTGACTKTSAAGLFLIGAATVVVGSGAGETTGRVRLSGVAVTAV